MDLFRLSLTLFGKWMFFARTNGDHSSGAENAEGLPNRNSHNARHSNRPLASRARSKRSISRVVIFVELAQGTTVSTND
jgi:hypothetical protein